MPPSRLANLNPNPKPNRKPKPKPKPKPNPNPNPSPNPNPNPNPNQEGIVAGGGTALLYCTKALENLPTANFDQKVG